MTTKTISIAIIAVIAATLLTSCRQNTSNTPVKQKSKTEKPAAPQPVDVEYIIAENYFIKNGAELPADGRITDQKTFNQIFGMATTMGKKGKPTEIDFDKQFVIAVETGPVQKETELSPASLVFQPSTQNPSPDNISGKFSKDSGSLTFEYSINEGKSISYTIRPVLAIIVDKAYEDLNLEIIPQF